MNINEFKVTAHQIVDWIADYFENIENFPVKSQVKPGEIYKKLPDNAPEKGEDIDSIFNEFREILLPGITHWQSPSFFAYFPANNSFPSILAEMLTSAIGSQCMVWETSPAAAELEEKTMNWLKTIMGIPDYFEGVIQDSASTSTLAAILTAREKYSDCEINKNGFRNHLNFKVYCSSEAHSSIEKAVKIAGLGKSNLTIIEVDEKQSLKINQLEKCIIDDIANGFKPLCVIAAFGTTGTIAFDPLEKIARICKKYNIWLHVDAAYAGTALILPEYRHLLKGIEQVDSFVFNPHKWMFTNFDCSAYFVKDKHALIQTFEILPEYLKTKFDNKVNNYRDWGVPLGRRFRALKLWFVLRSFGVEGLRNKLRLHITLANELAKKITESEKFELMVPVSLNTLCFRYNPGRKIPNNDVNKLNEVLLEKINKSGKIYLTHTKINNAYVIRMVIGQTNVEKQHVEKAWQLIQETAEEMKEADMDIH